MGDEEAATLRRRATWATVALAAVLVMDVVGAVSDWLQIRLLDRAIRGEDVALSSFDADDTRQGAVAILQLIVFVAAVVLFVRWFHRAYVDLPRLRAVGRFRTGWAIGGWFVPILNLWRPKQIANDLWRGTEPVPGAARPSALGATWSQLLTVWWVGFLVVGFVEQRAGIAYFDAPWSADAGPLAMAGLTEDAEEAQSAARLDLVASVVDIPVAVLAILVVRALTARHVARPRVAVEPAPPLPAAEAAT